MQLACDSVVPGLGCDYVAEGDSAEAVHGDMMAHGGSTHAELMKDMSPAQAMQAKEEMDTHIRALLTA